MPVKNSRARKACGNFSQVPSADGKPSSGAETGNSSGDRKVRNLMGAKGSVIGKSIPLRNGAESEQASITSGFASSSARAAGRFSVYFLASSFNAAMKKLEQSLQLLQKNEDRLRFWGVERSDDPNLAGDLLQEFGLWLDRRREFPRKVAELNLPGERR